MLPGPPKLFRTWPTVASPQAQKRLDDDAEMILWLMGLPRRSKTEEGEDKTPEGIWERPPQGPKPQQGWEQPPRAPKVPGHAAYPGLFQGLLYRPPGARGLLDLDPHDPFPRPMPAWPAPGASSGAAQFANTLRLAAETDLRPATLSLSNPGSLPPEPVPQPQPQPYMEGGAAGGADWRDVFSPSALDKPPSPFGDAARGILDPQRGQPLFNPPPARQEMPEFRAPAFLLPGMLQLSAPGNSEGTDPKGLEPLSQSDERFAAIWPHIGKWEGGYSNDRADSGGETMHGISQEFVKAHGLDIKNLRELTEEQAHNIVKDRIYYGHNIDLLPPELQPQALDASMRAEYGGIKDLQQVLNDMGATDNDGKPPEVDGGIGEKTLEAVDSLPPERVRELRDRYAAKQVERYQKAAKKTPSQSHFERGWLNRTEYFRRLKPPR